MIMREFKYLCKFKTNLILVKEISIACLLIQSGNRY